MKRITISLPEDLAEVVEDEARRRRCSVSELVRDSITRELGVGEHCKPRKLPFIALGKSDYTDTAARFDEYLEEAWDQKLLRREKHGD